MRAPRGWFNGESSSGDDAAAPAPRVHKTKKKKKKKKRRKDGPADVPALDVIEEVLGGSYE